ncbi:ribonucleoside-triphosphate reductase, adenosylcobalamin-dependent [Streptomyces afghaniensis]|uniref:ribonucleoside-triphosphate reductase, adenosylcobalamin-dependent n=1 Tax=Streptomyces afghaniensis TaxID=66865 RepID=UPI002787D970|nr:ribonucleoside-triphosphate reductase, adenosylcobalamin-dependent [Streptomyces afghaniensis]MDQ1016669.1 ribonucleoside-triphosphate reductase [Streptomyces afghaniensis]
MTAFPTETAKTVYERTYSRVKPSGEQETWEETVERVVDGNLALVPERYTEKGERAALLDLIGSFKVLPAGRHLKSSGVADFALNNCWASAWNPEAPEEHFTFSLLRLAEGGGVGANYSSRYFEGFPELVIPVEVHIVCDPDHADFLDLVEAGLISTEYSHEWTGAYQVQDSREGWAEALGDLIRTAHDPKTRHAARVYDVSRVRAKGTPLKAFGGTASGPQPFGRMLKAVGLVLKHGHGRPLHGIDAMQIDHEVAQCIVSGGVRRSARMSIMHWRDPLIWRFLRIKAKGGHWTTNISVEIDDDFIRLLRKMSSPSMPILREIAAGMLRNGEPGIWNSSLTAEGEVDGTYTTNPCGEATLTPWEPCNLGSVNLGAFVSDDGEVDWTGLEMAHRYLARYLIRATFAKVSDPKSEAAIARYRRIGVGHLGFADFLVKRGITYSEAGKSDYVGWDLADLAYAVDKAAAEYARILRIPVPIKTRVIAPTGTTSKLAGTSGEAAHAPFAGHFKRRIRFSDLEPSEKAQVEEYRRRGYHVEPDRNAANTSVVTIPTKDPLAEMECFQHAGDLSLRDMLSVQALYQEHWADQAVSYTVNVDPQKYSVDDLIEALVPFLPRLKGTTVFPELSFEQPPYERITKEEYEELAAAVGIEVSDTSYDEICASGACPI